MKELNTTMKKFSMILNRCSSLCKKVTLNGLATKVNLSTTVYFDHFIQTI